MNPLCGDCVHHLFMDEVPQEVKAHLQTIAAAYEAILPSTVHLLSTATADHPDEESTPMPHHVPTLVTVILMNAHADAEAEAVDTQKEAHEQQILDAQDKLETAEGEFERRMLAEGGGHFVYMREDWPPLHDEAIDPDVYHPASVRGSAFDSKATAWTVRSPTAAAASKIVIFRRAGEACLEVVEVTKSDSPKSKEWEVVATPAPHEVVAKLKGDLVRYALDLS